jgi:alkanesulfonate monooxygenase SsuD/methylene tetrahydromethanopterin reductase-like flavin-dependent oxidoreductase (luciferase family)
VSAVAHRETALRGSEAFGYVPPEGSSDADLAREKTALFLAAVEGQAVVDADPRMTGGRTGRLPIQPQSPGLRERIWWGSGTRATAEWTARQGMNLMSSTLLVEDTGVPFDELQAEQIARYRAAWAEAGWERQPRISVSRSVLPIVSATDREYFGSGRSGEDQVGILEGVRARFGKSYVGEPDVVAEELAKDAAVREADTLLITVPNMLGVDYNTRLLENIVRHVAPAIGWLPREQRTA